MNHCSRNPKGPGVFGQALGVVTQWLLVPFACLVFSDPLCAAEADKSAWQEFVQKLATSKSTEEYEKTLADAKEGGPPPEVVFEGQLLRVFATEDAELAGMLAPEVRDRMGKWTSNVTIFEHEMEFLAFSHFVLFLDADQKKDSEGAKQHLAEAFWNLPAYAKNFGEALEKRRAAERMANLRLDLDEEIQDCEGNKTSLRKLLGDKKAILLDFWASWCGPCLFAMPELKKKAESLGPQGIVVVAMNTENDAAAAKSKREEYGMEKVPWIMDLEEKSYSERLEVEAIPCMVLVDREGKILFKGHPFSDREELAKSLQKIDPTIALPAIGDEEG